MTTRCLIDHITVTAPTLQAGAQWVSDALGIVPPQGGEHPRMGTHNLLLRLGNHQFLEVIAINPEAPAPDRPRWFALDELPADGPARLTTWVLGTENIETTLEKSSEALGKIEAMSRAQNHWHITIPEDGSLPLATGAPALIQWHCDPHPATQMEDFGLTLTQLQIFHPEPDRVRQLLQSLELDAGDCTLEILHGTQASMSAHILTPQGVQVLS